MKKIMLKECKSYTFRQADGTAVPFIKGKITECSDHVYKQAMQTGKFIDVSEVALIFHYARQKQK